MEQAFSDLVRLETVHESGADVKLKLARLAGRREDPVTDGRALSALFRNRPDRIGVNRWHGKGTDARNDGQRAVLSLEPFARPDPVKRSSEHVLEPGLAKLGLG